LKRKKKLLQKQLDELTTQNEEADGKFNNLSKSNQKLKVDLQDLRDKTDGLEGNVGKLKKNCCGT